MTTSTPRLARRARVRDRLRPRACRHLLPGPLQRLLLPADAAVLHRHRRDRRRRLRHPGGPLERPRRHRHRPAPTRCSTPDVDVSISASMDVDHGTVQPLQTLFGDAAARPGDPDLHQLGGHPAGTASRRVARARHRGRRITWRRWTSGCWSSAPVGCPTIRPCPTLATAPPAALDRIVRGEPMTAEQRAARQTAVMEAAHDFAHGREHAAAAQPGLGSRIPGTPRHRPARRRRRLVQRLDRRARPATPRTRSAPGWRPSPRSRPRGRIETEQPLLPRGAGADRGLRHPNGGARMSMTRPDFDTTSTYWSSAPAAAV